ncbi:hypothetical protein COLO4_30032 [Corchorus olitorius]|uniref:Uncharacterized protein n=1 Tax=Corchorus olitorius TaxID=93759 RepID=A0A1R3HBG8_9ROSI|nr:hypothetical protein COLO4_30032 [Corchorus olitorius]
MARNGISEELNGKFADIPIVGKFGVKSCMGE